MDFEGGRVVVGLFDAPSNAARTAMEPEVDARSVLLNDCLGHARIYPMEPRNTRAKSLAEIRDLHLV